MSFHTSNFLGKINLTSKSSHLVLLVRSLVSGEKMDDSLISFLGVDFLVTLKMVLQRDMMGLSIQWMSLVFVTMCFGKFV